MQRYGRFLGLLFIAGIVFFWSGGNRAPAGDGHTKIDPMFNYLRLAGERAPLSDVAAKMANVKSVGGVTMVGCMIKVTDMEKVADFVEDLGGSVKTRLEAIMTAEIPLSSVQEIAELPEVVYIEAAKKVSYKMNEARAAAVSNVAPVQDGTGAGLSQAYTGSGVVVGVIDSGLDCSHSDFTGRIINYKVLSSGTEYTSAQIAAGECADSGYHGTHVTGIAAGADSTYKGVAPGASIVVAELSSDLSNDEIIDGVEYVFQKAQAILAPAVANLSIGHSVGPHDGTSLFEAGIDETVANKEGRSVVCAAGNETVNTNDSEPGYTLGGLHAGINVAGTDTGYEMIFRSSLIRSLTIEVWLESGGNCGVELAAYNSGRTQILTTGEVQGVAETSENTSSVTTENLTLSMDFSDYNSATNSKQHAQGSILLALGGTYSSTDLTYDLIIRDNGGGCQGNAWLYLDYVDYNVFTSNRDGEASPGATNYTYSKGDSDKMITIPATSNSCIAVASFASRGTWVGKDGEKHQDVYNTPLNATGTTSGQLSLYSSHGPGVGSTYTTYRQKPDISAPGEPIISTLATDVSAADSIEAPDSKHVKLQGTSMSSPFVAGVVALMLEKDGCMSYSTVKSIITDPDNVITTGISGALPDYEWGAGKIDALASVNATADSGCHNPDNPSDNPASGGGCSVASGARYNGESLLFAILIFSICCLAALNSLRISRRSAS